MVNRFDLVSGYMQKWPEGNWIEYEDYAALEKDNINLAQDYDALCATYGVVSEQCSCQRREITELRQFIANLPKGVK